MGKAKKTRKFGLVKRTLNTKKDQRLKANQESIKDKEDPELTRNIPQVSSALFFQYNEAIKPPYQVLIDTNFINFSIQKKVKRMAGILSKTLSEVHPSLRTNGMGIGNTHRRISLGFLPPNKKNPLVRKFRARKRNTDQRSFRSLTVDFGSNVHEPSPYLGNIEEEPDLYYHDEEDGELSRTISLPSRVSETPDLSPQDVDWILHEHERRYSSVYNSCLLYTSRCV